MWLTKGPRPVVVAMTPIFAFSTYLLIAQTCHLPPRPEPQAPIPCTTLPQQASWVLDVAFSPTGQLLAIGVGVGPFRGHCVLWDLTVGSSRAILGAAGGATSALDFSADGRLLATGSTDGEVVVWDVASAATRIVLCRGGRDRVWRLALSPDGRVLASGGFDKSVKLWRLDDPGDRSDPGN